MSYMQQTSTRAHGLSGFRRICLALCVILTFQAAVVRAQEGGTVTLSGTVISSVDNQPLIGVAVFVEGTTTGVTTDIDGNYTITVPSDTKEITFSSVGYLTKKIRLGANNVVFKVVSLDESTQFLEDAVSRLLRATCRHRSRVI